MVLFGITKKFGQEESKWDKETQTKETIDWTHYLSSDAVGLLREVLESAYKHRSAYFKAKDIKMAQVWSAILELQRQIDQINEKIDKLTPKEMKVYRTHLADDSHVINKLNEVMTPSAQDTKGATDALVNSLMRF